MLRFSALVSYVPLAIGHRIRQKTMTTPTKNPPQLAHGILTPSCDITPTRETAREDDAYDEFASLGQNDCSEAPRDGAEPSEAPAVSVEPAYDGAEPSPSSPFTYDGDGDRAVVGAAVYYFHDDGTDFQVPARAVHHAEQALVHLKLALDVARQLHLIS